MKTISQIIILLFLVTSCKKEKAQISNTISGINIDSLEQVGFEKYSKSPIGAIEIFKRVAIESRKNRDYKKSGQTYLNIAGIYEEKISNFQNALLYTNKSLEDWINVKDTMQIANLYKYKGYVEALNGNFKEAENNILKAIHIYENLNFEQGIAVSNINMSRVQILKSDLKKAKKYFNLSKDF